MLTVDDLPAALAFFRDALGLNQVAEFRNGTGTGYLLEAGKATLELFDQAQAAAIDEIEVGRPVSGPVRVALQVDDSESIARALQAKGWQVVGGPVVTPWGDHNVRIAGPEAIQLTLFTPPARVPSGGASGA